MAKIDAAKVWSLNYRLLMTVITSVSEQIAALGLEIKELFVLAEIDEHPYPADLATTLCMPKPTVTVHLKTLEAAGFVKREIDAKDLRRHRPRTHVRSLWFSIEPADERRADGAQKLAREAELSRT
jgi:DNA-binding MarR family transcriptional regulator